MAGEGVGVEEQLRCIIPRSNMRTFNTASFISEAPQAPFSFTPHNCQEASGRAGCTSHRQALSKKGIPANRV